MLSYTMMIHEESSEPVIHIHFHNQGGYTLDDLFHLWITYYESETHFSFVFHTKDITESPSLWQVCKMAMFMYSLTLRYPIHHYLRKSEIMIPDTGIRRMLDWIFAIQSPVAPVYIYDTHNYTDIIDNNVTPIHIVLP
jgi:hypothetical protein